LIPAGGKGVNKMKERGVKQIVLVVVCAVLGLLSPCAARADEKYAVAINFSRCAITKYKGGPAVDLVIPDTIDGKQVTDIAYKAFYEAQLSGSVTIPDGVTSIGEYAFCNNSITRVNIPESVTTIGRWAFANNQLAGITIPPGVKAIREYTFYNNRLINVDIFSGGVTGIEEYAFSKNRLTGITIPAGIAEIDAMAFSGSVGSAVAAMEGKSGTYIQENGVWYLDGAPIPAFAFLLPSGTVGIRAVDGENGESRRFGKGYLLQPGKHSLEVSFYDGFRASDTVTLIKNFEAGKTYWPVHKFISRNSISFFVNEMD
jgi:hypothetical protein